MKQFGFLLVSLLAFLLTKSNNVDAVPFEMTFYTEEDMTGANYTVYETNENFLNITESFGGAFRSFCFVGSWHFTAVGRGGYIYIPTNYQFCSIISDRFYVVDRVFRLGPTDTETPSLTLLDNEREKVVVIEAASERNLTMPNTAFDDLWAFTSGGKSWRIWEKSDFQGNSACIETSIEVDYHLPSAYGLESIGSVAQNC